VLLIEPDPTNGILFMFSPASFTGRRTMLEYAYRTTRERVAAWFDGGDEVVAKAGWTGKVAATAG
jgi:hypothetical protein